MDPTIRMGRELMMKNQLLDESANWFANRRLGSTSFDLDQETPKATKVPSSLKDAYLVQKRVAKKLEWRIGGWKLGGTNEATRSKFGCNTAYYGPIDERNIIFSETADSFDWNFSGSLRGEAEISVRLNSKVNIRSELTSLKGVFDYIDLLAPSLECPYSTIMDIKAGSLNALVSDLCGSGVLVVGNSIPVDPALLMCDQVIELAQVGNHCEIANTRNIIGFPVQALFEFLNLAFEHNLGLREGQWVATGGCTSCIELHDKSPIIVKLQGAESVRIIPNCT